MSLLLNWDWQRQNTMPPLCLDLRLQQAGLRLRPLGILYRGERIARLASSVRAFSRQISPVVMWLIRRSISAVLFLLVKRF